MQIPIDHIGFDDIKYGNPSREDVHNIKVKSYLDEILPSMLKSVPFRNSSIGTKEELNKLVTYAKYTENSARRNIFDGDLVPYMEGLFVNNGADAEDVHKTVNDLVIDILPVITKLKYEFQRPRPFQLACYYNLAFYPAFSKYVSSPSYPSGHTVLCLVIAEVLSYQYATVFPGCHEVMTKFSGEVMESRLYLGVHYPSDNTFGCEVANAILLNSKFRQKYEF